MRCGSDGWRRIAGCGTSRYGRGMRFPSWLVAWCVLVFAAACARGQEAKEGPRVAWSLVVGGSTFRSAEEVVFSLREPKAGPGKDAVREVQLELRQGNVRIARWPYAHQLPLPEKVKDERKDKAQGYLMGLPRELLEWTGELAAGQYEMAFLVNGVRATNVAAFRIDPAFEERTAPVFEIGVLERAPLGDASRPILWIVGPEPADRRITAYGVTGAPWLVDGVERKRTTMIWAGALSVLGWGERYDVVMDSRFYEPGVDAKAAHDYAFDFAGRKSNTQRVDPQEAPLGEAWDAAVVQPGPEWPVSVRGVVTDAKGKPAAGYQVWLQGGAQAVRTLADAKGEYALPGSMRHGMYKLIVAKNDRIHPRRSEVVEWRGETLTRDFDFRKPVPKSEPPALPTGKQNWCDLEKAMLRLGKGLDVNARDGSGNTGLSMAITAQKFDIARKLVEAGAEVNTTRGDHTSILALAIMAGDRGFVEYLLAKGADPSRVDGYESITPLMVAARKGSAELVEVLLDHGATVEGRSSGGMGVMEWAVRGGSPEVIALLAQRGAKVDAMNDDGRTPLMAAAHLGKVPAAEALIAAGAGVNTANQDGWTPLGVAAFCQAKDGDYPGVVQALLKAGARMDARTVQGDTPVMQVANSNRADLLEIFREAGAKVYYGTKGKVFAEAGSKIPPLDARRMMLDAIQGQKYAVIQELAELGMDMNAPIFRGYTPLMYAVLRENAPQTVKVLLASGADANAAMVEVNGDITPLLAAAMRENADVVRALLAAGAKVDVRDGNGKTPLEVARQAKHDAVVKVLEEAGAK
jgi:ankyrin repeat protein